MKLMFGMSWSSQAVAFNFRRHHKVIVVLDVVESVRLMASNEFDFILRWHEFVRRAREEVLPAHGGRMLKSLGDGLMLEFPDALRGVGGALALHALWAEPDCDRPHRQQMHLRAAAHLAQFVSDEYDVYGTDVNLAARLVTLAGPGELVVSAELRAHLPADFAGDVEDLGGCHLKHVAAPVRVFRIGHAGPAPVFANDTLRAPLQPAVAVMPFVPRASDPQYFAVGELIADGLVAALGGSPQLRVLSRHALGAASGRRAREVQQARAAGASYLLAGSFATRGRKLLLCAELADTQTGEVTCALRLEGELGDLLRAQNSLCEQLAQAMHAAAVDAQVQRARAQPLPTLESGCLLLGGIALTHGSSAGDFARAREVLEALVERHPRSAQARAWLAKWYLLRVQRGASDEPQQDARRAIEQTERALDAQGDSALALAVQGHALSELAQEPQAALERIERALALSPSGPLAWLYKSVWSSNWGSSGEGLREAEKASRLSPIGPMRYYYDMVHASALSQHGEQDRAIELAKRSLRAHRGHAPTLQVLLFAQALSHRMEDAKATLGLLRASRPRLSVASYLGRAGSACAPRQRHAEILRDLGVPER